MPFLTVKLTPGVHSEPTPLLLQASVVQSNNIRWREGLPEKLGGWQKFYYSAPDGEVITSLPVSGVIREMWPWADFNSFLHFAAGGDGGLFAITDDGADITPMFVINDVTPAFTTDGTTSIVHVLNVDHEATINVATTVVLNNYVSVGGLILYGAYPVQRIITIDEVIIDATRDPLNPQISTSAVTSGGIVSTFTSQGESSTCIVTLPLHGFSIGQQVVFLPTVLPGSSDPGHDDLVVEGAYTVLEVIDANRFTIGLRYAAITTVGPIPENGGNVEITYWIAGSPVAAGGAYGIGPYGAYDYGTPSTDIAPVTGTKVTAENLDVDILDWCMVNFGQELIVQPEGEGFFRWTIDSGYTTAYPIAAAPSRATGFFLAMPQQQLVAYGASTGHGLVPDPMLVRWCDNANYNVWTAAVENQAGSFRLARGSKIVGGMQAPMQAMLWTDIGMWLMTYIGYPDVWGFNEVAQECGLIAKKAVGVCGGQTFWMARDKFWTFMSGQVAPLPCPVWDAVFQNLNIDLLDRIRCGTNSGFDEVCWFYPSLATRQPGALQENDSYVKFNRTTGEWDYGTPVDVYGAGSSGGLMVSDWIDNNVFGHPISAMTVASGTESQIMWQEMARNADTEPMEWWFRTGLFILSEGEDFIFIDRCRPDFRWRKFGDPVSESAEVKITLYAQDDSDNPSKPPAVYGPFLVTDTTGSFDPRARGRYFSFKVEGDDLGSFARLGAVKFRFSPDGRAG